MIIIALCAILICGLVVIALVITVNDFVENSSYKRKDSKPGFELEFSINAMLCALGEGREPDLNGIERFFDYIGGKYDCSDFHVSSMLRVLYQFGDRISPELRDKFIDLLCGFSYWMDQGGSDGMCKWTENHQVLFISCELLAGQLLPDAVFCASGLTGNEHRAQAERRVQIWLRQRWLYGFAEWRSNTYYKEDIAALTLLADFAQDTSIKTRAAIILDLMIVEVAMYSFKGVLSSDSGRMYERYKKSPEQSDLTEILHYIITGEKLPGITNTTIHFFLSTSYSLPPIAVKIAKDGADIPVQSSCGLDLEELRHESLGVNNEESIMMQWGLCALTNAQTINNSLDYIRTNRLFENPFLFDFRYVNYRMLRWLNLLPLLSRTLNPQINGKALQRTHSSMYKTPHYAVYCSQSHHPGFYGDQQQIFQIVLDTTLTVFITHPAVGPEEKPPFGNSPGYWVGNGRLPHSVQYENVGLHIFRLPLCKSPLAFIEKSLCKYTHAWFPSQRFDEIVIKKRRIYARYNEAYVALIAKNDISYADADKSDLIQQGRISCWITEMSCPQKDTGFEAFISRVESNRVRFSGTKVEYESEGRSFSLHFGGKFKIDGAVQRPDPLRLSCSYGNIERKASQVSLEFGGEILFLDFDNCIRKI